MKDGKSTKGVIQQGRVHGLAAGNRLPNRAVNPPLLSQVSDAKFCEIERPWNKDSTVGSTAYRSRSLDNMLLCNLHQSIDRSAYGAFHAHKLFCCGVFHV